MRRRTPWCTATELRPLLTMCVIDRREIEEGKVDIQFGIDDGGDVVKVYK